MIESMVDEIMALVVHIKMKKNEYFIPLRSEAQLTRTLDLANLWF